MQTKWRGASTNNSLSNVIDYFAIVNGIFILHKFKTLYSLREVEIIDSLSNGIKKIKIIWSVTLIII